MKSKNENIKYQDDPEKTKPDTKIKTTNHNKREYKKRNVYRYDESYSDAEQEFYLSGQHATDAMIQKFADEQLTYFNEHPEAYNLGKFFTKKGVLECEYYTWVKRSPYLKRRHEFCIQLLALRRNERIAAHDPKFLTHTLHMYSPRHDEANRYKAKLRNLEDATKEQAVKVVFEDFRDEEDKK